MRKYLLLLFCIFYAHCVMAQEELDTHQVGDVIYSVFKPDDFNKLHGGTWMLLAGQDFRETDLFKYYKGIKNPEGNTGLPDARGVFIRGVQAGRNDEYGDVDAPQREVGSYQFDALKQHTHDSNQKLSNVFAYVGTFNNSLLTTPSFPTLPDILLSTDILTNSDNKPTWLNEETQPDNYTLYIYIKVNNEIYTNPNRN